MQKIILFLIDFVREMSKQLNMTDRVWKKNFFKTIYSSCILFFPFVQLFKDRMKPSYHVNLGSFLSIEWIHLIVQNTQTWIYIIVYNFFNPKNIEQTTLYFSQLQNAQQIQQLKGKHI